MIVPSPRASALLLAGFDPVLAGHVAVAVAGYVRAHIAAGAPVPAGLVELGEGLAQLERLKVSHRGDKRAACRGEWLPVIATLPVSEAARLAGRSRATVYRHLRDGQLRPTKINGKLKVHIDDLADYLAGA